MKDQIIFCKNFSPFCSASPEIIGVKVCNRLMDRQTDKFFDTITGVCRFLSQLYLLPPYLLCWQGDNSFCKIESSQRLYQVCVQIICIKMTPSKKFLNDFNWEFISSHSQLQFQFQLVFKRLVKMTEKRWPN